MPNPHAQTILTVDDSSTTRAMIRRVIGMTSLEVGPLLEAADGAAALAIMESTRVDLVLADLNMPVMDGMEMIATMRSRPSMRNIPVVVISAQPDPLQIEHLKRDGVAGYLPKPFTPEGMSSLIGPLLESARRIAIAAPPPQSFNPSLAEALVEALETMAFISPDLPDKAGLPPAGANVRVVHIGFHGEGVAGSLSLAAPAKFGQVVAANCGDSNEIDDSDDALKELANVTCGLLLRKRADGGAGFKMTPPVMGRPDEVDQWTAGPDVAAVSAEGFLVTAHVAGMDGTCKPK